MVMRVKIAALWTGLVLLALLTLLWTVLLFRGGGMDWDWGISIVIVWLTTGILAAGATVFAAGRLRILMGIAMLVAVTLIALLHSGFDEDWDVVWASWQGAVCLVQIGWLSLLDLRRPPSGVTAGSLAAGSARVAAGRLRLLMGVGVVVAGAVIAVVHSGFDEDWDVVWASWLGAVFLVQIGLLSLLDLRRSSSAATAARWLR